MGLNPEVLHKILKPESTPDSSGSASPENRRRNESPPNTSSQTITLLPEDLKLIQVEDDDGRRLDEDHADGEDVELEFDSDDEPSSGKLPIGNDPRARRPSRFRVRLSSHSNPNDTDHNPSRPVFHQDGNHFDENALDDTTNDDDRLHAQVPPRLPRRTSTARVKAEYVLAGPSDHPTPQIRLVLSDSPKPEMSVGRIPSPAETAGQSDPMQTMSLTSGRKRSMSLKTHTVEETRVNGHARRQIVSQEETDDDVDDVDEEDEFDGPAVPAASVINRVQALQRGRSNSKSSPEAIIPTSPRLEKVSEVLSPIWALTSGTDSPGMQSIMVNKGGLQDLSLGEPAISDHTESFQEMIPQDNSSAPAESGNDVIELPELADSEAASRQREIIISVPSDVAFFELLCQALNSLSDLHEKQQKLFNEAVGRLCQLISASIRPSSSSNPIKNIRPFSKRLDKSQFSGPVPTEYSKSDLYAWREIFTLWIEAQIFESSSERTRGERTVEEAEARLKAFAAEVVKRGLGDRRTLRRKESREAWEEFLRLNMLLLDLKRFQLANVNAARKYVYRIPS